MYIEIIGYIFFCTFVEIKTPPRFRLRRQTPNAYGLLGAALIEDRQLTELGHDIQAVYSKYQKLLFECELEYSEKIKRITNLHEMQMAKHPGQHKFVEKVTMDNPEKKIRKIQDEFEAKKQKIMKDKKNQEDIINKRYDKEIGKIVLKFQNSRKMLDQRTHTVSDYKDKYSYESLWNDFKRELNRKQDLSTQKLDLEILQVLLKRLRSYSHEDHSRYGHSQYPGLDHFFREAIKQIIKANNHEHYQYHLDWYYCGSLRYDRLLACSSSFN